jgi:pimeloyl-ACP methyl ester carboxylesterase
VSVATPAVVLVSGGSAISPFTTPDAACRSGLAAGNTDTYLREGLLAAGHVVYTSPANAGPGVAQADTAWQGFDEAPEVLPEHLTVNSVGDIDDAGERLAAFLGFLAERHGHTAFDLVGHSMGGLFSRAAMRVLRDSASSLSVRSLTTLGTPWTGAFPADQLAGDLDPAEVKEDPRFPAILDAFVEEASATAPGGASEQVTHGYLAGANGWNARQAGVLDGFRVTLIGGDAFSAPGSAQVWPNDGLVSLHSALAEEVPASVLPYRVTHTFPDAHSIFFADYFGLPWERALTWDPDVLAVVLDALANPRPV